MNMNLDHPAAETPTRFALSRRLVRRLVLLALMVCLAGQLSGCTRVYIIGEGGHGHAAYHECHGHCHKHGQMKNKEHKEHEEHEEHEGHAQ